MKRNLRRLHIAFAMALATLAICFFPTTSYAAASDYGPPYPSNYGSSSSCFYMIRFGDTMSSVAARYGTSILSLMQMNGTQNPNLIYAGTGMRVPCASAGYRYMTPYPYQSMYSYPRMYPYRKMYQYPGMNSYYGTYPYQTQLYPSYSAPSYPTQVYPMQPYVTPGYPTPVPMSTPPATDQIMVVMRNIAFNPATLTIHVGQTVVWRNDDVAAHTTTSGSCAGGVCTPLAGWDSGTLNPGQSFSHQFTMAGTFSYYCRIHGAMMQGTIMVMP